jgi:hypothetical protein
LIDRGGGDFSRVVETAGLALALFMTTHMDLLYRLYPANIFERPGLPFAGIAMREIADGWEVVSCRVTGRVG